MSSSPTPIRTIVILVQENRSFDHMIGWMKSLNPSIDGVTGSESNPISTSDPSSSTVQFSDRAEYVDPDPGHSIQAIYEQVYGVPFSAGETPITPAGVKPTMNGFVQQAESQEKGLSEAVMNGFRPDSVPVYRELVSEFAVCDRWFASMPASTQPNRLFVHSATSHGLTSNDTKKLVEGLPQKTIFDSLDEAGFDFGIYYQYPPATLFYRSLRKLKYIDRFHPFDLSFKRHCKEGKLPNYVVVEQRYFDLKILPGNDDHPSHDVAEGQKFVKEVYEALRSSPQWNEILFVVTYDEHGGFFDHVPTPVDGVPSPDGIVGPDPFNFKFDRLGVRVPTIFISPWIEKGIVTLPEVKKMRTTEAAEGAPLSDFQRELVQLAAVLNGDHANPSIFPDALVQGMTVAEGAKYTQDAFKAFLQEAQRCRNCGSDESYIVALPAGDEEEGEKKKKKPSWFKKWLACLVCNQS
ncbi:phospholipase C [Dendrobium catenatum]|uniref:Phospholipase C n=1 Tax=Dendrobium catenatum TaxID=906689 RepID=A0A2I0WBR6_9ASPA|nr:phospholipase C [Dendrobium catenatum]